MALPLIPPGQYDLRVDRVRDPDTGQCGTAVFDRHRVYRYLLTRVWTPDAPLAVYVMLNPSTASALEDDPTIRRCIGFARREGTGGLVVVNLFALRATNPQALRDHKEPVGRCNDAFIRQAVRTAGGPVIAAWGAGGVLHDRSEHVMRMLRKGPRPLQCLGVTATGQPRHPLYLAGNTALRSYDGPGA
ncbi:DUF1643 domain-containing protein [Streptomyces sp. NPDC005878]|uniref:DUF1643 domain-containing protein n=1 Tax=Streptomyces sp. NPDC005878 TaxID=3157077 RepID=UPI0033CB78B5